MKWTTRAKVRAALARSSTPESARSVIRKTGLTPSQVTHALWQLERDGEIEKTADGWKLRERT